MPSRQAPFCVHPKTGKVCVPIDPEHAWEFDPDTVCTVGGLLNQLNSGAAAAAQVGLGVLAWLAWPWGNPPLLLLAGCVALPKCDLACRLPRCTAPHLTSPPHLPTLPARLL